MITTKLRLRDGDKKSLGTISGISPEAGQGEVALFIEGVSGLRNSQIQYAFRIYEELIYNAGDNA